MTFEQWKAVSLMFGTPVTAPAPPATQQFKFQIKLSDFFGTQSTTPDFLNKLQNLMEIPGYSPGPTKDLVTTPSNQDVSNTIHQLFLQHCKKGAADFWKNRPQFDHKGFEMLADLHRCFMPTGQTAIFVNYVALFNIQQKVGESIASFASRIWDIYGSLSAGGIVLDEMVLTLIMMNGLSDD